MISSIPAHLLSIPDFPLETHVDQLVSSGGINYGHHNANLVDVTMDETSHSVYLAGGQWVSFTQKTGNGGSCHGDMVAVLGGCNNLDQDVRIACVRRTDA